LGERLLCKQEVVGSIPSGSTRSAVIIGRSAALSLAFAFGAHDRRWFSKLFFRRAKVGIRFCSGSVATLSCCGGTRKVSVREGVLRSQWLVIARPQVKGFALAQACLGMRVLFDIVKRRSLRVRP
jgi:hypothetical protein